MLLLCPSFAIQRQVLFIPLKHVRAGNIIKNAAVPYNVRRCNVCPIGDLE